MNYTYDANGRLISTGNGAGNLVTYSYDRAGNLLTMVSSSPNNTLRVFISPMGSGHVAGSGLTCPSICTQPYTGTQSINLTAAGEEGYRFIGWGGGQTGSANPLTFSLAEDMKVTAYFGAESGQTDTDGVADGNEMGPTGDNMLYDGNNDGIPDYQQANVASLPVPGSPGNGYVTLSVPAGLTLVNVRTVANPSPGDTPAGLVFPYGLFAFSISGLAPGGCTTVNLDLPLLAAIDHYYHYGPTPDDAAAHWYSFATSGQTGAQISHGATLTSISLAYCDAQRGDDNLTADSQVVSLGGPTRPVVYTVAAESGGNGAIAPATRNVNHGLTTTFSVTPASGYRIASVTGCGGTLSSSTYTTGAITADCAVRAEFTPKVGSLTVNITPQQAIDGGVRWRRTGTEPWLENGAKEENLPIGNYTIEFTELAGLIKPPNLTATINDLQTTTLTGGYVIYSDLCRALNNCTLPWTIGGSSNWFGQTTTRYCGDGAAQSGDINDGQSAWLQTTVTGPGELSFHWKVSSETCCDYLEFFIDNVKQTNPIKGEVDWTEQKYAIPAGQHTLRWQYRKDSSVSRGSDCGWLDRVLWPNLGDAILGLQVIARAATEQTPAGIDVDCDDRLGIAEVLYTLQKLAGLR